MRRYMGLFLVVFVVSLHSMEYESEELKKERRKLYQMMDDIWAQHKRVCQVDQSDDTISIGENNDSECENSDS